MESLEKSANYPLKQEVRKEYIAISAIFLVFLCFFICYFSKLGHPIADCGREAYMPYRLLNGEVLFKDIFCIYGAFSYYFNELMYKVFGANLSVLYVVGGFLSLGIIYGVYFNAREFLNRQLSLTAAFFVMFVCAFSTGIFNYIFPYSYAMLWALLSFLYSLLFLIKYLKTPHKKYISLCALLWGLSVVNKHDYFLFIVPLILTIGYYKPLKRPKELLYFFVFPAITLFTLMVNGVGISDFLSNQALVNKVISAESLKLFYTASAGMYYSPKIFSMMLAIALKNIPTLLILIYLVLLSRKIRYKFLRIVAIFATFALTVFYVFQSLGTINNEFAFFPLLVFLMTVYSFIKYGKDRVQAPYLILMLSAVTASLKKFFFLSFSIYGTYAMAVLIIAIVVSLYRFLHSKMNPEKYITLALCLLLGAYTGVSALSNFVRFQHLNKYPIKTSMGEMKTAHNTANDITELINFILKYTKKTDKVVILPEGQLINFLTGRDSGMFYDSLTPLYFEAFGESKIIEDFKEIMPKYIVLSNRDTSEYGAKQICVNYGMKFCSFVDEYYQNEAKLGYELKFYVFARKVGRLVK